MNANQRVRIDTGTRTSTATSPLGAWVTASSDTRWCEVSSISPAMAVQRYDIELDAVVRKEFRFYDKPTITLGGTRFVWFTNGSDDYLKIYWPKSSPVNADGEGIITTVLVEEDREKKVASV